MGACTFRTRVRGKTAQQAFERAREDALWERGHGGYTGTIAEKQGFTMIQPSLGETPSDCANRLIDEGDPRIDDKWGPAGCIRVADGEFLFFGWASS